MIILIVPLLLFFAIGSISPLLISEDTQQIVDVGPQDAVDAPLPATLVNS